MTLFDFAGSTYSPAFDRKRLERQLDRFIRVMSDGEFRTPHEIEKLTGDNWASCSARFRDCKRLGYTTERKRLEGAETRGIFLYRLCTKGTTT